VPRTEREGPRPSKGGAAHGPWRGLPKIPVFGAVLLLVPGLLLASGGFAAASGRPPGRGPTDPASAGPHQLTAGLTEWTWNGTGSPCTGGTYNLSAHFTASASGGTPPYAFRWQFGDGTDAATGPNPVHAFVTPGPWNVTAEVTDATGGSATFPFGVSGPAISCPSEAAHPPPGASLLDLVILGAGVAAVATVGCTVLLVLLRRRDRR